MSALNFFEDDILDLLMTNVAAPNVGDASGLQPSATAGSFQVSLQTANPAETATAQTTSEAAYGAYARVAVARSLAAWTVAAGVCDNDSPIPFGPCTVGTPTITHFSIGSDVSGAGNLFFWGALTASLAVSPGITPSFAAGALDITAD